MSKVLVFPLRAINALIGWWWYGMEIAADWIVQLFVKSEYVRTGRCNRCGTCCQLLAIEMPRWLARRDLLVWLVSRWHQAVLNFDLKGVDDRWLVYSCRYYDEQRRGCRIHRFRHRLCRYYPRQRLYGHPKLHPGCGFSFVRRDGKPSFDEVLRGVGREKP